MPRSKSKATKPLDRESAKRSRVEAAVDENDGVKVLRNYINGKWCDTDDYIDSYNPATGLVHAKVPKSSDADVNAAVEAADGAFKTWSRTVRQTRANKLYKIANAIEQNLKLFAEAESRDQGKPVWLAASVDVPRACYNFRFFADVILHQEETATIQEHVPAVNYTQHTGVGVAGLITPWNLPLYLLTWKVAPALAFGNTVVCKPSEITSVTAFMLAEIIHEVGLEPGVFNVVFGDGKGAGAPLVEHPRVPLISFTGGTATGKRIASLAAPHFKKTSLELGGKNPCIVFEDVDIPKVVEQTIRSSFTNQGEICLCTSRIYVQETIFDEFMVALVAAAKEVTVGPPSTAAQLGALVSKEHRDKIRGFVKAAKKSGGVIHCGETMEEIELSEENAEGYYMRPTIITNLKDDHKCLTQEIFGPVITVLPFRTEDEAVQRANDTSYGLAAVVCSKDGSRAQRVAQHLEAGTVWINCWMVRDLHMPFGGVKQSGTGRESAKDSMEFFTEAKTICTHFGA